MKDWKGNEVKHGDTVYLMKIRRSGWDILRSGEGSKMMVIMDGEVIYESDPIPISPELPLWGIEHIYEIDDSAGNMITSYREIPPRTKLSSSMLGTMFFDKQDHNVVAIKGKSDDGAEYWAAHLTPPG